MGLIRRPDIQQMARAALVMNLGDIAREGERAVVSARAEAERILADARTERDALVKGAIEEARKLGMEKGLEEGRKRGVEEGRKEAFEAANAELAKLQSAWEAGAGAFEATRGQMLAALRRDALALAVMLAERVVRRAIEVDEGVVVRQLEAALEMIARATRIVVAVHPEDEALIREALPRVVAKFSDVTHAEIARDAGIERGGCVVRTDVGGVIDASIRTQIERLAASIGVETNGGGLPAGGAASEPKLAGVQDRGQAEDEKSRSAA